MQHQLHQQHEEVRLVPFLLLLQQSLPIPVHQVGAADQSMRSIVPMHARTRLVSELCQFKWEEEDIPEGKM